MTYCITYNEKLNSVAQRYHGGVRLRVVTNNAEIILGPRWLKFSLINSGVSDKCKYIYATQKALLKAGKLVYQIKFNNLVTQIFYF